MASLLYNTRFNIRFKTYVQWYIHMLEQERSEGDNKMTTKLGWGYLDIFIPYSIQ